MEAAWGRLIFDGFNKLADSYCMSTEATTYSFGSWSIITILIAWCLAMLSQTQTHCIHPLHRSTETKAVFLSLSYWIVFASGQNCVQRVHFVFPQISVSMFATRYMQPPYAVVEA